MKCSEYLTEQNAQGRKLYLNGVDVDINDELIVLIEASEHVSENETIENFPLKSALEDLSAMLGISDA